MNAVEKHRKEIGWVSIFGGVSIFFMLGFVAFTVQHNRGLMSHNISVLERAVNDMLRVEDKPLIIVHFNAQQPSGILINWPHVAEKLLGWTWQDINENGLTCIMPKEYRAVHNTKLTEAIARGPTEPKTMTVRALHKDGSEIPVKLTVWVSGKESKNVNAIIEAI